MIPSQKKRIRHNHERLKASSFSEANVESQKVVRTQHIRNARVTKIVRETYHRRPHLLRQNSS